MVVTMITGASLCLGISLAVVVIIPASPENLLVRLVMGIVCIDAALLLIFSLRGLAEVFQVSTRTLEKVKTNFEMLSNMRKLKYTRLFIKSCAAIKMRFGGNNFAEMLTPLNCISHAVQFSVQILLLERNIMYQ